MAYVRHEILLTKVDKDGTAKVTVTWQNSDNQVSAAELDDAVSTFAGVFDGLTDVSVVSVTRVDEIGTVL